MPLHRVVVVGASAAGLTAAEALRRRGFDGTVTLIGDEPHPPYDRPPLSKQVLAGSWQPERAALRDGTALDALDAEFLLGRRAVGLDVDRRRVLLDGDGHDGHDGHVGHVGHVDYDAVVIATGVRPRSLPGADLAGVHLLRTLDDALALRTRLLGDPKVVVVGAGFLGCEVAAAARTMGRDVTVVDPAPAPLHRLFGDRIGARAAELHRDHGVVLRLGVGVTRFRSAAGRVIGLELADGSALDADVVVLAVGAAPATGWLADSGLPLADGVVCDDRCRAAPHVYAAGDVASWHNPLFGTRMRVEHRMNATEQAMAVAGNLLGDDRPFAPVPYFWTDQYDTKIQAYGIFPAGAPCQITHGDPDEHRFVASYGYQGRVVGVLGWNSPREVRTMRRLITEHAPWPTAATV